MRARLGDRPPREDRVAISSVDVALPGRPEDRAVAELARDQRELVDGSGARAVNVDLLQPDDVAVETDEDVGDALGVQAPFADAPVHVVRRDAQPKGFVARHGPIHEATSARPIIIAVAAKAIPKRFATSWRFT